MPDTPLPPSMHLAAVREWALAVMRSFGLFTWRFAFNRRVSSLGQCLHGPRRIELSVHLIERNPPEEIRETLLHECAHALVGPRHGHDAVWKAKAVEIGARPERCGQAVMPEGRWKATCGGCGARFHRHRRPRQTTYSCRACGRDRGRLTWAYA
jgi:predicted SprT family Zn-dependent metalloprotease